MPKIMLVIDNKEDRNFLEKIMSRLEYDVIAMRQGVDLSEQLIDHFPDVVFASTLGKNEKILSALGKIKEIRGKPKLVFVKQEKESTGLNEVQKRIIDGVLYSPVDPFKLIDVLAHTTDIEIRELRRRYNELIDYDRNKKGNLNLKETSDSSEEKSFVVGGKPTSIESETVKTKEVPSEEGEERAEGQGKNRASANERASKPNLINDPERSLKYDKYLKNVKRPEGAPETMDGGAVRLLQQKQSNLVHEGAEVKENRNHFLKTLFSTSLEEVKKKPS